MVQKELGKKQCQQMEICLHHAPEIFSFLFLDSFASQWYKRNWEGNNVNKWKFVYLMHKKFYCCFLIPLLLNGTKGIGKETMSANGNLCISCIRNFLLLFLDS